MKADRRFLLQPMEFWANVRTISETVGYTSRRTGQVKRPTFDDMHQALHKVGLGVQHLVADDGKPTGMGVKLLEYFDHRALTLNNYVEPKLMNAEVARAVYEDTQKRLSPTWPVPNNKQQGDKRAPAYFTGIINSLIEAYSDGLPCDYNPRKLATITREGMLIRTFARQFDGAFTSIVNPVAVWEIKEYYYTTTFGGRVADGVYETLLDGMELEELREHEHIDVKHYLMIDSHYTWWDCGRSYLCRIFDMLHMGYVDEVLFGYEVVERLPDIVGEWKEVARQNRWQF